MAQAQTNLAITNANGGSDVCGTEIIVVLETRGFSAASDIKESFLPSLAQQTAAIKNVSDILRFTLRAGSRNGLYHHCHQVRTAILLSDSHRICHRMGHTSRQLQQPLELRPQLS